MAQHSAESSPLIRPLGFRLSDLTPFRCSFGWATYVSAPCAKPPSRPPSSRASKAVYIISPPGRGVFPPSHITLSYTPCTHDHTHNNTSSWIPSRSRRRRKSSPRSRRPTTSSSSLPRSHSRRTKRRTPSSSISTLRPKRSTRRPSRRSTSSRPSSRSNKPSTTRLFALSKRRR